MKSLASSMLVLWLLCWAHCSLSRFGVVQGSDACTCCAASQEHAEDSHDDDDDHHHDIPLHTSVDCGVCDFLTHGVTLIQKLPSLTAHAAAVLPPASWEPAPLPLLVAETFTLHLPHDPPPLRAFGEVLTHTACPVRGPTQA